MTTNNLTATPKGELPHLKTGKRKAVAIRLPPNDHAELEQAAEEEMRSMSFIALRRYQAGLQLELAEESRDKAIS